jgi:hypothetical protein
MFIDARCMLGLFARFPLIAPDNFEKTRLLQLLVGAFKADSKSTDSSE